MIAQPLWRLGCACVCLSWPAVGLHAAEQPAPKAAAVAAAASPDTGKNTADAPGNVTPAMARAVRATVQAQLADLAAGRAAQAFSHATPAIRQQFGDATRFMAMVESAYPMLLDPANLAFLQPTRQASAVLQRVQVQDRQGRSWMALYQLEQQPDGRWRIAGCVVVADEPRRIS